MQKSAMAEIAASGGSADLLGLGIDQNGSGNNGNGPNNVNGGGDEAAVTDNLDKFYCKSNGVLYEDAVVQIGVKTECKSNLARLALFYGNKTSYPFLVRDELVPDIVHLGDLERSIIVLSPRSNKLQSISIELVKFTTRFCDVISCLILRQSLLSAFGP